MPTSTSANATSTAATSTPTTPIAKQLTKAVTKQNKLVDRMDNTYTRRYINAHHSLHNVYTALQTLKRGPPVGIPDGRIAIRERFLGYVETHRREMRNASARVRKTRESLARLKKDIVELKKQVAAEKQGLVVQAEGMKMSA